MQNTFAYKKNRTLLELLYDCVHPIFQNRNKGDKCSNLRNTYLYESHKTDRKVLNNVCEELRRVLDSTAKYKFNAQRQLIDSLTSKLNKSQDGDLPFYIIAESVANDENNDSK